MHEPRQTLAADPARARAHAGPRRLVVLGSTGSIGTQTLQCVAHLNRLHAQGDWPIRHDVVGLCIGGASMEALALQAHAFPHAAIAVADPGDRAAQRCHALLGPRSAPVHVGPASAERIVRELQPDLVVAGIVGFAGLHATLAAVELGIDVALANKETLVAAGGLIVPLAKRTGAALLPIDSEHSGVWQCLGALVPPCPAPPEVRRVVLTASGGPLWNEPDQDAYEHAPLRRVLAHPTWSMGKKVTIDCASLTNKAMEIIEAHWLFGLPPGNIDAVIHPASLVHALVEMIDGSIIMQCSSPDMRSPILRALTFPSRAPAAAPSLDPRRLGELRFIEPDRARFVALDTADRVMRAGGTSGAIFNAANEAAVDAFANGRIAFGRIPRLTIEAIDALPARPIASIDDVLDADVRARAFVNQRVASS